MNPPRISSARPSINVLISILGLFLVLNGSTFTNAEVLLPESRGSLLDYLGIAVGAVFLTPPGGILPSVGIEAGANAFPQLGVGGFFGFYPSATPNPLDSSRSYNMLGEVNYFFENWLPGARAGIKGGLSYTKLSFADATLPAQRSIDLIFGPHVGYDHTLGNGYTIGAEAGVLMRSSAPLTPVTSLLVIGKYWF